MAAPTGDKPAPTNGEVANVMRIRDELARRISKVSGTGDYGRNSKVGKAQSVAVAEALIAQGLIDLERLHRDIIEAVEQDDDDAEGDE